MSVVVTSLRLPKTLKDRIGRLAKRAGQNSHAFMLRLLEEQVQAAERLEEFVADAQKADELMRETGMGYAAADVHEYLDATVRGRRPAARPKYVSGRK
jgi:predicted DNA-binding protein